MFLATVLYPLICVFGRTCKLCDYWALVKPELTFPAALLIPLGFVLATLLEPFIFFIAYWFEKPAEFIALMLFIFRFLIAPGVLMLFESVSSLDSFVSMFSSIKKSTPWLKWSMEWSSLLIDSSLSFFVSPCSIFLLLLTSVFNESSRFLTSLTLSIPVYAWTLLNIASSF